MDRVAAWIANERSARRFVHGLIARGPLAQRSRETRKCSGAQVGHWRGRALEQRRGRRTRKPRERDEQMQRIGLLVHAVVGELARARQRLADETFRLLGRLARLGEQRQHFVFAQAPLTQQAIGVVLEGEQRQQQMRSAEPLRDIPRDVVGLRGDLLELV